MYFYPPANVFQHIYICTYCSLLFCLHNKTNSTCLPCHKFPSLNELSYMVAIAEECGEEINFSNYPIDYQV